MNFQQLRYVVEISRCGSINKAAQNLFMSQSSISSAVKELEAELGIILFKRGNRGVEFTREGRDFLAHANALLEQKEHIENLYRGNISDSPLLFSVSTQRYPFAVDAFIRLLRGTQNPRFGLSIKEAGMDTVIEDVYDHRSDLGIIFLSSATERMIRRMLAAKGIEFILIAEIPPCVFVRKGHPLTVNSSVSADELGDYVYLSFEHDQSVSIDFSEEFQLLSYKKPPRVINVNDRATAVDIIASTDAITTGSGLLMTEPGDSRMVSIPLRGEEVMRLGWIRAKNHTLSAEAAEYVSLLENSIADAVAHTNRIHRELIGLGANPGPLSSGR